MKKWDELPIAMQNEKVRYYYDVLQKHETELKIKRLFDVVCSFRDDCNFITNPCPSEYYDQAGFERTCFV